MAREKLRGDRTRYLDDLIRIAAALLLILPNQGHASVYCMAGETKEYLEGTLNARSEKLLAEGEKFLTLPSVKLVRLLNGSSEWQLRGQKNFGIFEFTGADGDLAVLKIVDSEQFANPATGEMEFAAEVPGRGPLVSAPQFKEYLDVHSILGHIFVAPKLFAILTAQPLAAAFRGKWSILKEAADKFEFDGTWIDNPRYQNNPVVGVVMERLPAEPHQGPLHPISRPTRPNQFLAQWSKEDLVRAIRDVIEIRRRVLIAGVDIRDQQFVVTPAASAHLIDLDQARFGNEGTWIDVSYEILKLIDQWQTVTGDLLDAKLKFYLLDEAAQSHMVCTSDQDFEPLLHDWRCAERLVK